MDGKELGRRWSRVRARRDVGFLVECLGLYRRIDARDRIYMLAGGAFITLIPLAIVVASALGATSDSSVGERMVERLELSGAAEQSVLTLFTYPPGAVAGVTAFSLLLLLYSLNGFFGSVQRTFEGAWDLPRMGYRGAVYRTGGAAVLFGGILLVGLAGSRIRGPAPLVPVLTLALQVALLTGCWVVGTDLLLSRRLRPGAFLWGSVLNAVIQLVVGWGAAIYLPMLFSRQTSRYGVIGAALALVTLMIIFAALIVGGAIVGAVLGRATGEARGSTDEPSLAGDEPPGPGGGSSLSEDQREGSVR